MVRQGQDKSKSTPIQTGEMRCKFCEHGNSKITLQNCPSPILGAGEVY